MRSTAMKSASNQFRAWPSRANSRAVTCAGVVLILISLQSRAQVAPDALSSRAVVGGNVKRHADAVLAVMS
jgi:hypothetical protein